MIRLRVFDSTGRELTELVVPEEGLVVGRAEDAGLCLPEKAVSRRHARLYFHDGELVVEDEASANGVYVEGMKADGPTIVAVGQKMRIGTFTVLVEGDAPAVHADSAANGLPDARPAPHVVQLIAREGPLRGERFRLQKDETTIGRVAGNEIVLDDASISRRHAKIVRSATGYTLFDLRSSNGSRIGGRKVSRAELKDGDCVQFGDIPLVFSCSSNSDTMVVSDSPKRRASRTRLLFAVAAALLLVIGVAAFVLLRPPPAPRQATAEEILAEQRSLVRAELDRGNEALRVGDLVTAEAAFRSALDREPISSEARIGLDRVVSERIAKQGFDRAEGIFHTRRELDSARALYEAVPQGSVFHARAQDRLREIRTTTAEEERRLGREACRIRSWRTCQERLCRAFELWPRDVPMDDADTLRREIVRAESQLGRLPDFRACELPVEARGQGEVELAVALASPYPDEGIRAAIVSYAGADLAKAQSILGRLSSSRAYRLRAAEIERVKSKLDIVEGQAAAVYRQIQAGDLEAAEASFRTLTDADTGLLPESLAHRFRDEIASQLGDAFHERGAQAQATGDLRAAYRWWLRGKAIAPDNPRLVTGLFDLGRRAVDACNSGTAALSRRDIIRARTDFELCRDISEPGTDARRQAEGELSRMR